MSHTPAQRPSQAEIIEALPKDHLRSLFYLFSAKPDSRIKVFEEPVHLELSDLIELNTCVTRKLNLHKIDSSITTAKVAYIGKDISEFGTWIEFAQHHWQEPERIEEVVVKWDFLVNIDDYATPQCHTLIYRVSNDAKPGKILQMIFSGNSDEFDNIDMLDSPAFCRVDFINAQLSKELMNVVSDWHSSRKKPALIPDFIYKVKKKRQSIATIVDYIASMSLTLLLASFLYWIGVKIFNSNIPNHVTLSLIFIGFYGMRIIGKTSNILAKKIFTDLKIY